MRYIALATDYDATLAEHGIATARTIAELERFRESGRKLLMVTGRELPDLLNVFPRPKLFDRIVAENGALLYNPETREETPLAEPANHGFVDLLRRRGITDVGVGRVIVATSAVHSATVIEAIQELGLELHPIFNKGSLMILPSGVNKATGLKAALRDLGLSAHNTVAVGDAENDHAFLEASECAVAVANALPSLKERADIVTAGAAGDGVNELIGRILADDLRSVPPRPSSLILLGTTQDGRQVAFPPYGDNMVVAGRSGAGKSTLTTGVVERLCNAGYQFCIVDPEGDYGTFANVPVLGDTSSAPTVQEALGVLEKPDDSLVLNLLGIPFEQRPGFFQNLLPRLQEMRARLGRPHWIIVDEAHHLMPRSWEASGLTTPKDVTNLMLITVEPDHMSHAALSLVRTVVAAGESAVETISQFCRGAGLDKPRLAHEAPPRGEALLWRVDRPNETTRFKVAPCHTERVRHSRKYADGELPPDRSFYFRGPDGKLNLRAQNLTIFMQLMDGIDDDTWMHHLRQGDFSRWFREAMKSDLSEAIERIEEERALSPAESRARIREEIERHYTLPA